MTQERGGGDRGEGGRVEFIKGSAYVVLVERGREGERRGQLGVRIGVELSHSIKVS